MKLKNFRFSDHHVGMLSFFSERFGTNESEIVRRALDDMNSRYGLALKFAERLIGKLRDHYGDDARLEIRPEADSGFEISSAQKGHAPSRWGDYGEVFVDGQRCEGLIGTMSVERLEERLSGRERYRVYLEAVPDSEYAFSAFGQHARLYIGEIDLRSPAALSIRLGDLRKEMQEFWGLVGYPGDTAADDDQQQPAFPEHEEVP